MAEQKLLGKRAIVTGGATGIGYGIAERFIAEGANVIITDIDETGGTRAALALGDHCQFVRHDVSVPEHWNALFVIAQGKFSGLDILVNVAGVTLMGNIEELDVATWDKTMASFTYDKATPYFELVVPTKDSTRYSRLLRM